MYGKVTLNLLPRIDIERKNEGFRIAQATPSEDLDPYVRGCLSRFSEDFSCTASLICPHGFHVGMC